MHCVIIFPISCPFPRVLPPASPEDVEAIGSLRSQADHALLQNDLRALLDPAVVWISTERIVDTIITTIDFVYEVCRGRFEGSLDWTNFMAKAIEGATTLDKFT